MTIENVVNQALDLLGYSRHIGNIYEGSAASRVALDVWSQTRDSLLTRLNPDWARKDAILTLIKSAPNIQGSTAQYDVTPWNSATNPPLPWLYEYTAPSDCVYPLQIKPRRLFLPVWRPRPQPFRHVVTPAGESILTNTPDALLIYTYRVTDPDAWQYDFRDAMIQLLAQKMQAEFAKRQMRPEKEPEDADTAS